MDNSGVSMTTRKDIEAKLLAANPFEEHSWGFEIWSHGATDCLDLVWPMLEESIENHEHFADLYKESVNIHFANLKAEAEKLAVALEKINSMNRQTAVDKYGDASKADDWACIKVGEPAAQNYRQKYPRESGK